MVAIFATATALLTPEFVESFDPAKLASKFVKVEKEYGVKFNKTKSTFNIVGHWESVRNAHKSLKRLMAKDADDPFDGRAGIEQETQAGMALVKVEMAEDFPSDPDPDTAADDATAANDDDDDGMAAVNDEQEDRSLDQQNQLSQENTVYKIKGNPKRGRHAKDSNKESAVPDPVVYFQYQDSSFTNEDGLNMEEVLEEYERTQVHKKVTKDDLKKILDKNTDQMGRPLNRGLPRGASLPEKSADDCTQLSSSGDGAAMKAIVESNTAGMTSSSSGQNQLANSLDRVLAGIGQPDIGQFSVTGMDALMQYATSVAGNLTTAHAQNPSINTSLAMSALSDIVPMSNLNDMTSQASMTSYTNSVTPYGMIPGVNPIPSSVSYLVRDSVPSSQSMVTGGLMSHELGVYSEVSTSSHQKGTIHYRASAPPQNSTPNQIRLPEMVAKQQLDVAKQQQTESLALLEMGQQMDWAETMGPGDIQTNGQTPKMGGTQVLASTHQEGIQDAKESSVSIETGPSADVATPTLNPVEKTAELDCKDGPDTKKEPARKGSNCDTTKKSKRKSKPSRTDDTPNTKVDKKKGVQVAEKKKKVLPNKKSGKSKSKPSNPSKPLPEVNMPTTASTAPTVSECPDSKSEENKLDDLKPDSDITDKSDGSKLDTQSTEAKEKTPQIFKCTECDYQGRRKKRLTEHMGRVHGLLTENCRGTQEQTAFPCDQCDKSFVFGKDLNRHKKIVHHGQSHFCPTCNKSYKSKYVFDKHMATHAEGYIQPMFTCQICERKFTTKFSLGSHIKSEHLGLKKTFLCPTCGKSFSQIRSYRQHANVHAGIRPYVCEICNKSFTYDKSLKEHRYMHDNIRRFPCSVCGKAFRQRTCLLIHMKVHKDTKDHICSSCGKGFTQKQSLLRHERIHSGDKPYMCKLCNKSFSDYAVIRKHMLMSHKKNKLDWKSDIIAEEKKMSDHYISGGPGYVPREISSKSEDMKNEQNVGQSVSVSGQTFIGEYVFQDQSLVQSGAQSTLAQSGIITPVTLQKVAGSSLLGQSVDNGTVTIATNDVGSLYGNPVIGGLTVSQLASVQACSKTSDLDLQVTPSQGQVNMGNLQVLSGPAFIGSVNSSDPTGLLTDENMVAAFLKQQGSGVIQDTGVIQGSDFISTQVLAPLSSADISQRVQGQGQLTFSTPSSVVTATSSSADCNMTSTNALSNWEYQYPVYYNYQQFQSNQPN